MRLFLKRRHGSFAWRRTGRWKRTADVGGLLAALSFVALLLHTYGLSINVTDSMPIGIYHSRPVIFPIKRGDIVEACLPMRIAAIGRHAGYLFEGTCPGRSAAVLKVVAAVGGDEVQVAARGIVVNARRLRGSEPISFDTRGRRVGRFPQGTYILRAGQLWLWTPNPRSWDSRYYGPVDDQNVQAEAMLILPLWRWMFGDVTVASLDGDPADRN